MEPKSTEKLWAMHCNGAYIDDGIGIAAVIESPSGVKTRFAAILEFTEQQVKVTNNVAEYEALLLSLRKMKDLGQPNIIVKSDSKVITDHVEKESEARQPDIIKYLEEVRYTERYFKGYSVQHIPRSENDEVDKLAKAATNKHYLPADVLYEVITTPATRKKFFNHITWEDWIAPLIAFLQGTFEPTSDIEHKRIALRARNYKSYKGDVYKSGVVEPWLKCIPQGWEKKY